MASVRIRLRRRTSRSRSGVASFCVVAAVVGVVLTVGGCQQESATPSAGDVTPEAKPPASTVPPAGAQRLVGRWVRTDSPYVLEIASVGEDGSLVASYFNPSSINVFRAEAREVDATFEVFVELRDVNYPGSSYTLGYDVAGDLLEGTYHQAVLRQDFDVVFARE